MTFLAGKNSLSTLARALARHRLLLPPARVRPPAVVPMEGGREGAGRAAAPPRTAAAPVSASASKALGGFLYPDDLTQTGASGISGSLRWSGPSGAVSAAAAAAAAAAGAAPHDPEAPSPLRLPPLSPADRASSRHPAHRRPPTDLLQCRAPSPLEAAAAEWSEASGGAAPAAAVQHGHLSRERARGRSPRSPSQTPEHSYEDLYMGERSSEDEEDEEDEEDGLLRLPRGLPPSLLLPDGGRPPHQPRRLESPPVVVAAVAAATVATASASRATSMATDTEAAYGGATQPAAALPGAALPAAVPPSPISAVPAAAPAAVPAPAPSSKATSLASAATSSSSSSSAPRIVRSVSWAPWAPPELATTAEAVAELLNTRPTPEGVAVVSANGTEVVVGKCIPGFPLRQRYAEWAYGRGPRLPSPQQGAEAGPGAAAAAAAAAATSPVLAPGALPPPAGAGPLLMEGLDHDLHNASRADLRDSAIPLRRGPDKPNPIPLFVEGIGATTIEGGGEHNGERERRLRWAQRSGTRKAFSLSTGSCGTTTTSGGRDPGSWESPPHPSAAASVVDVVAAAPETPAHPLLPRLFTVLDAAACPEPWDELDPATDPFIARLQAEARPAPPVLRPPRTWERAVVEVVERGEEKRGPNGEPLYGLTWKGPRPWDPASAAGSSAAAAAERGGTSPACAAAAAASAPGAGAGAEAGGGTAAPPPPTRATHPGLPVRKKWTDADDADVHPGGARVGKAELVPRLPLAKGGKGGPREEGGESDAGAPVLSSYSFLVAAAAAEMRGVARGGEGRTRGADDCDEEWWPFGGDDGDSDGDGDHAILGEWGWAAYAGGQPLPVPGIRPRAAPRDDEGDGEEEEDDEEEEGEEEEGEFEPAAVLSSSAAAAPAPPAPATGMAVRRVPSLVIPEPRPVPVAAVAAVAAASAAALPAPPTPEPVYSPPSLHSQESRASSSGLDTVAGSESPSAAGSFGGGGGGGAEEEDGGMEDGDVAVIARPPQHVPAPPPPGDAGRGNLAPRPAHAESQSQQTQPVAPEGEGPSAAAAVAAVTAGAAPSPAGATADEEDEEDETAGGFGSSLLMSREHHGAGSRPAHMSDEEEEEEEEVEGGNWGDAGADGGAPAPPVPMDIGGGQGDDDGEEDVGGQAAVGVAAGVFPLSLSQSQGSVDGSLTPPPPAAPPPPQAAGPAAVAPLLPSSAPRRAVHFAAGVKGSSQSEEAAAMEAAVSEGGVDRDGGGGTAAREGRAPSGPQSRPRQGTRAAAGLATDRLSPGRHETRGAASATSRASPSLAAAAAAAAPAAVSPAAGAAALSVRQFGRAAAKATGRALAMQAAAAARGAGGGGGGKG
jgi:hypothetical protein